MLSTSAYAQITSGILRGTVKDVTGSTIENANVNGYLSASGNTTGANLITTGVVQSNTANISTFVKLGNTNIQWGTATTTAITAGQVIASVAVSGITGVEFLVKGVDATGGKYSIATVQAVTDGTTVADYAIFGSVWPGVGILGNQ